MLGLNVLLSVQVAEDVRNTSRNRVVVRKLSCYFIIIIVILNDFGHGGQSQRRSAIYAGDITVHKCVPGTSALSVHLLS